MRSREDIQAGIDALEPYQGMMTSEHKTAIFAEKILEILLDIRDLLSHREKLNISGIRYYLPPK